MHTCNTGSSSLFKYHKKGEFECYESCDLFVGIIRKMYIINGYECDCVFYANENHVRVCYNNEEEWFNSTNQCKYKYKNQCLLGNETDCKFKVEGEGSNNYFTKVLSFKKRMLRQ